MNVQLIGKEQSIFAINGLQTKMVIPPLTYYTTFGAAENPISEGGVWLNGELNGYDWTNCQITDSGVCAGDHLLTDPTYADSTAVLNKNFGPDQMVQGTLFLNNVTQPDQYPEVEFRLRTSLGSGYIPGYEIGYSVRPAGAYIIIVLWSGGYGEWKYIVDNYSISPLSSGDVLKATITGNVINVYINDTFMVGGTDDTYTTGSVGVGFYRSQAGEFGFNDFYATEL